jgi:hypothetical protein
VPTLAVTVAVVAALVGGYFGLRGVGKSTATGGTQPSARAYAAMAYDPDSHDVVMFGGAGTGGAPLADTWLWSGSSWSEASPAQSPPGLIGAEMAWDPRSHRVILVGGLGGDGCRLVVPAAAPPAVTAWPSSAPGCVDLAGAWAWDGRDWAELSLPSGVGTLNGAAIATDPSSGTVVLVASGSTWTFDGSAFRAVASAAGTGSASQYAGEVWFPDPALLFDYGITSLTSPCTGPVACPFEIPVTTAWKWTGTAWSPVTDTVQPLFAPPFGAMSSSVAPAAADLADGEVVTVDGGGVTRVSDNPVQGWDVAAPASALGYRSGPALAYDPATGRVVLFGGYVSAAGQAPQLSAATWSWDGRTWSGMGTAR